MRGSLRPKGEGYCLCRSSLVCTRSFQWAKLQKLIAINLKQIRLKNLQICSENEPKQIPQNQQVLETLSYDRASFYRPMVDTAAQQHRSGKRHASRLSHLGLGASCTVPAPHCQCCCARHDGWARIHRPPKIDTNRAPNITCEKTRYQDAVRSPRVLRGCRFEHHQFVLR